MKNEHKKPFVGDFLEFAIRSTAMGNSKTSDLRPKSQRAVVSDLTASNQGANTLEANNEGNERDPPLLYDWNYPASHNSALLYPKCGFQIDSSLSPSQATKLSYEVVSKNKMGGD